MTRDNSMNSISLFLALLFLSTVDAATGNQDAHFSAQEKDSLGKFREAVKSLTYLDYQNENIFLIRWLRAKALDINEAKEMLGKSLAWRKNYNIDNIAKNETILKLEKQLPSVYNVVDKDGRPIILVPYGAWDIRKFMLAGNRELLSRYTTYLFEKMVGMVREVKKKGGKDVTQWFHIMDMNGYSGRQHACLACVPFYLDHITNYEENYPNTAAHIILLNSPRVFEAIIQLMRPVMSEATREALKVFGTNKLEWEEALLKLVPRDQMAILFRANREKNG